MGTLNIKAGFLVGSSPTTVDEVLVFSYPANKREKHRPQRPPHTRMGQNHAQRILYHYTRSYVKRDRHSICTFLSKPTETFLSFVSQSLNQSLPTQRIKFLNPNRTEYQLQSSRNHPSWRNLLLCTCNCQSTPSKFSSSALLAYTATSSKASHGPRVNVLHGWGMTVVLMYTTSWLLLRSSNMRLFTDTTLISPMKLKLSTHFGECGQVVCKNVHCPQGCVRR